MKIRFLALLAILAAGSATVLIYATNSGRSRSNATTDAAMSADSCASCDMHATAKTATATPAMAGCPYFADQPATASNTQAMGTIEKADAKATATAASDECCAAVTATPAAQP